MVGGELWHPRRRSIPSASDSDSEDPIFWARTKTKDWFSPGEQALKDERLQREEENVLKFRVDDSWNVRAMWTGRVKSLLLSAGVGVAPVVRNGLVATRAGTGNGVREADSEAGRKRWTGSVGVSIAYST